MLKNIIFLCRFIYKRFSFEILKLQVLMIFNSTLQIFSIVSFGPLILVITKNENFEQYRDLYFYNLSSVSFLLLIIFSCVFIFIFSNIVNVIVSNISLKLSQKIGSKLGSDFFSLMINKSYSFHVNISSSEISSKLTLELGRVINGIIGPLILFNSKIFIVMFIFVGLLTINVKVSLLVLVFFTTNYIIIFTINKKILQRNSYLISKNTKIRQKIVSESFVNMRETILFQSQKFFLDLFNSSNKEITTSIAKIQFLSIIPRYIIEIFAFLLIMIIISVLALNNALLNLLPTIAIYLVAGYKLLPALQNIASSFASIRGSYSSLLGILPDLKEIDAMPTDSKINLKYKKIDFDTLVLEKINFAYSYKKIIFKNASFNISKNQIVGLIGKTGIGKSTFIDIFCGLIPFQSGRIILNNENIEYEKYKDIKNLISIVPQKIKLLDDTIKNNIFFGRKEIYNLDNELQYLKKTCLLEYVNKNDNMWDKVIGENGSKLSGGQIQRLGIARALYGKPQILILDEATAGLDSDLEQKIIQNLINFKPKMTILIISHNMKVLSVCDSLFKIKNQKFKKIK